MVLTSEKLQSHSEAEEGVSIGQVKDRKKTVLQTPTHTETTVSPQKQYRSTHLLTEQHTQEVLKHAAITMETTIWADRRGLRSRRDLTKAVTIEKERTKLL